MKTIILTLAISLTFVFQSIGQINLVNNLSWDQWYEFQNNYFTLEWEEPDLPHDELIGYNVYRENELFIFVTETSIFNIEQGSNCGGEDFLFYGNGDGFTAYVRAVYNPGQIESTAQEIQINGPLLNIDNNIIVENTLYPNPTSGILNVKNYDLSEILIFDITGKLIKEYEPNPIIDLSTISKGIYIVKLISDKGITLKRVILK